MRIRWRRRSRAVCWRASRSCGCCCCRRWNKLGKTALATGEEIVHRHLQPLLPGLQLAQQLLLIAADDLRGGRRGRRAQVGNKISDRDVGFMADGADDRDLAGEDSPRHPLIVKTPQILQRTAAASDNQHVTLLARVGQRDGAHNLPGASSPWTAVG
jgi:hypothetical protein